MSQEIDNTQDVMDSRDIISRIESLEADKEALEEMDERVSDAIEDEAENIEDHKTEARLARQAFGDAEAAELKVLLAFQSEAESSPDWIHGESVIHENYFTQYTEQLIDDCYEMPEGFNANDWPWRHMTMDFEAAAEEAKQDYITAEFDGETYYLRA